MEKMGEGDFMIVRGEIKKGMRKNEEKLVKIRDGEEKWKKVSDIKKI